MAPPASLQNHNLLQNFRAQILEHACARADLIWRAPWSAKKASRKKCVRRAASHTNSKIPSAAARARTTSNYNLGVLFPPNFVPSRGTRTRRRWEMRRADMTSPDCQNACVCSLLFLCVCVVSLSWHGEMSLRNHDRRAGGPLWQTNGKNWCTWYIIKERDKSAFEWSKKHCRLFADTGFGADLWKITHSFVLLQAQQSTRVL